MPGGIITYSTPALSPVGGGDERIYHENLIDPVLLVNGTNVLAVEIHQFAHYSTDISFNLELFLSSDPVPDITANGSDGPVIIQEGDNLTVDISLEPGRHAGSIADWWILLFYYNPGTDLWVPVPLAGFQQPLFELPLTELVNAADMPPGWFIFLFGVDMNPDEFIDAEWFYDYVTVVVQ